MSKILPLVFNVNNAFTRLVTFFFLNVHDSKSLTPSSDMSMRSFDLWTPPSKLLSTRVSIESSLQASRFSRPSRELERSSVRASSDLMRFSDMSSTTLIRRRTSEWDCWIDVSTMAMSSVRKGRKYCWQCDEATQKRLKRRERLKSELLRALEMRRFYASFPY